MSRFGQTRSFIVGMLLLLSASACSRPTPSVPIEGASQPGQTPFEDQGSERSSAKANPQPAALIEKAAPDRNLPFQTSQMLPAGTFLTVRLKSPILPESAEASETFEAVIDEPAVIEGNTLIPRGTIALGKVDASHVSKERPERGYVRLVLESVNLDGFELPVQTAILFSRQVPVNHNSRTVRLEKGHRLTFRLTEPFYPDLQHSQASH